MDFRVSTMKVGGHAVTVTMQGELDLFTCPELQQELALVPVEVTRALIDLTGVTFVDSTGLGLLVRFAKKLDERGGSVMLVLEDGPVRKLLEVTALDRVFDVRFPGSEPARSLVGLSLLDSLRTG